MNLIKSRTLLLICLLAITSVSWAQLVDPPMPMGRDGGPRREQVMDRIKTIKVWKLTEKLDLTSEQSQNFFPIYNKFFDTWEIVQKQRGQVIQKLDDLIEKENPSEGDINQQLTKLDSLDRVIQDAKAKFRLDIMKVLTPKQMGQLYVFEVKFMMEMRDIIGDARQEMRGKREGRGPND
jgi:Spy/CpxP family protein refolding chaperone